MQSGLGDSQLSLPSTLDATDCYSQKAWYLLFIVLSIGRPARPFELSSLCALFHANESLVRYLCTIPNSPITVTNANSDLFVTISSLGLLALKRLVCSFLSLDSEKRKRQLFDIEDGAKQADIVSKPWKRIRSEYEKVHHPSHGLDTWNIKSSASSCLSVSLCYKKLVPCLFKTQLWEPSSMLNSTKQIEGKIDTVDVIAKEHTIIIANGLDKYFAPSCISREPSECQDSKTNGMNLDNGTNVAATFCMRDVKQRSKPLIETQLDKIDHMEYNTAQKLNYKRDGMHGKNERKDAFSASTKNEIEQKLLPCFESFDLENIEGSGGSGTVYKARRKIDGTIVAIKCHHENVRKHQVMNELRMLERFGGKNFIIKYDGHFKSGNSECFVLEHIEHDRPEVLKKDINIFQIRWYAYCLLRALTSLHKQGIVHRDVKPGNFLYSRKANKGYLIDFNLAMDLHRNKNGTRYKPIIEDDGTSAHSTISDAKVVHDDKTRRFRGIKLLKINDHDKGSKSEKKTVQRARRAQNKFSASSIINSQGLDGSGMTSMKDVINASAPRPREPFPSHGRKELISLLQEVMQSPNLEVSSVPTVSRKRVATVPPENPNESFVYFTPMPVNFASLHNVKGDVKQNKKGSCVGTKGFRAPEVLFGSLHQGPKVDIWSAGVTILFLIIGKAPFCGEPEQNIKDIAKLRGSEDLWELSKLHDQESSFPVELYCSQSMRSMTLWQWCKLNTKRPDFLDAVPLSLMDLVDKCLAVNPRLRMSAADALNHDFFDPCREALKRQRAQRQGNSLDSRTGLPTHRQNSNRPIKGFT